MSQVNPIEVQKYLAGTDYPIGRDGLLVTAVRNGAKPDILHALVDLPERTFDGPETVSQAIS